MLIGLDDKRCLIPVRHIHWNVKTKESDAMQYDVFISHASEDKVDVARPLAIKLQEQGLKVWFDEFELTIGDSLRRSIDRGLSESEFGVVILSPMFFTKEWPQKELDGLVAKESGREKVILPVWHNINAAGVEQYSPLLAGKLAVNTSTGIENVTKAVVKAIAQKKRYDIAEDQDSSNYLTWADIDEALRSGSVEGVPAGTDLEEFLWQNIPESRSQVEARNPGRKFSPRRVG